jgi:hypothetical protein
VQLALKFRNMLPNVVREELDNLVATIVAFWSVEHNADGTHKDIHANSITINGKPITGDTPPINLPLIAKGDLLTRNDTDNVRLPVGSIGRVLTADPSADEGLSWQILTAALAQSFVTVNAEASLANHRRLVAGNNVALSTATPGQLIISASGGGGTGGGMNLDYLGDFAPGPVYNDGDIVIGADGIAYMCVVDGTTTPPEPWPGTGVAVNATVDASYWVVSGHAALTNERVMSALANGYVKSTGGEPSTVAVIPVAEGGTGATTASAARTNLGVGTVGPVNLSGDASTYLNGSGAWSTPQGVPSGSIIFFTTPCPPGYTRMSAWDGRYVRMGPSHATGGAASHSHGVGSYAMPSHTHPVGTLAVGSHSHSSGTLAVASHSHPNAGGTNAVADHVHAFSGTTGGESNGSAVMDAGGGMNCVRAPHTHTYGGNTVGSGGHSHTLTGSTGTTAPDVAGNTGTATATVTGVSGATGPTAITGASDAQANAPLFVDFYACQKD